MFDVLLPFCSVTNGLLLVPKGMLLGPQAAPAGMQLAQPGCSVHHLGIFYSGYAQEAATEQICDW